MDWKVPLGILIVPLFAVLFWYVLAQGVFAPKTELFSQVGNLIKDSPGFESGVWYLSYEEPGKPALSKQLFFDKNSDCIRAGQEQQCDMSFEQGERVQIEGELQGELVRVRTLTLQSSIEETGEHIKLYFYNPSLDQGPGGVQCTQKGLVAVERVLPQSETLIADTIKLELRGEISQEETAQGIQTEFPLAGVSLKDASLQNGTLTLTFNDPQNKTGGASCRVGILWHQIEATAKQFPEVKDVRFMPEELFQP